ncbi:hypothetical protein V5799_000245 [Amblyomma americanum]|uniref:Uncharacterized protein n=1 Tax=Amblyomma americanum TaxID=6943 RepID=A0AAQ4D3L6_AMBAM
MTRSRNAEKRASRDQHVGVTERFRGDRFRSARSPTYAARAAADKPVIVVPITAEQQKGKGIIASGAVAEKAFPQHSVQQPCVENDMPAASAQYTLVGFSPELDWRALKFVKPLPPHRVCGACGLVRKRTALLPCTHVLCECCYDQCGRDGSHACPLDGNHYEEEDVALMDFPAEDLLRRERGGKEASQPKFPPGQG